MIRQTRILLWVLVVMLAFPLVASAQTATQATISYPNLDDFPFLSGYLDIRDAQGFFVPGLDASQGKMFEDGREISLSSLVETKIGARFIVAINHGSPFNVYYAEDLTRYDQLTESMQNWFDGLDPSVQDEFSLVTPGGILSQHTTNLDAYMLRWQSHKPDSSTLPSLAVLSSALDLAADEPPVPGMGRAIVFFTPVLSQQNSELMQSLAARAVQLGVRIYVVMVDSPANFTSEEAVNLTNLASQTGGLLLTFEDPASLADLNNLIDSARWTYQFEYRSQLNTAGVHQMLLQIDTEDGSIQSPALEFDIELQAPNPILVSIPAQILRAVPEGEKAELENLAPNQYPIEILVEFPDTVSRDIVRSVLYVNGVAAAENDEPPFDVFNLDVSQYQFSERIYVQAEVFDEIGLSNRSVETPIQITVQPPQSGWAALLSENSSILVIGVIVLAASTVLVVLVYSGRLAPKPLGTASRKRQAAKDPVTTPLEDILKQSTDEPSKRPTLFNRRLPTPRLPIARRSTPQPLAFLVRLGDDNEPIAGNIISINQPEITFGSDAGAATVLLADPAVEQLHARLWRNGDGGFHLADEGSTAGTWINFAPVTNGGGRVQHGDLIHIGRVGFRFTLSKPTQVRKVTITHVGDLAE